MYVTTWPETQPHWLSVSRMMYIFAGNNSLHFVRTGRTCETTSRATHAGTAFQCGIIIPGSTPGCALLETRASSRSGLNNSCIRGPLCHHPLAGGSAKEKQWYFKVLLNSGSQDAGSVLCFGHCVARRFLEVDPRLEGRLRGGSSYCWPHAQLHYALEGANGWSEVERQRGYLLSVHSRAGPAGQARRACPEGIWAVSSLWCTRSHLLNLDRLLAPISLRTTA